MKIELIQNAFQIKDWQLMCIEFVEENKDLI
ncbi:unnamed protein product, partial [Vitis vinifera]